MEKTQGKRLTHYVKDYVVFDLETTGFNRVKDTIIEISAIKVRNGAISAEFSTLVNPGRPIPPAATRVNGITDAMVASAPGLTAALTDFLEFIAEDILIGHNIHTFDLKFIYDSAWELLEREVNNDYIDTLYLSRSVLPHLKHYKLTDISTYYGFSTAGAHRALADCIMNQKCYEQLSKIVPEQSAGKIAKKSAEICGQCGGELIRRNGKFGEFWGCGNYPRCRYTKNI